MRVNFCTYIFPHLTVDLSSILSAPNFLREYTSDISGRCSCQHCRLHPIISCEVWQECAYFLVSSLAIKLITSYRHACRLSMPTGGTFFEYKKDLSLMTSVSFLQIVKKVSFFFFIFFFNLLYVLVSCFYLRHIIIYFANISSLNRMHI